MFLDICKVPPVEIHISPQTHQVAGAGSERSIRSHLRMRVWVQLGGGGEGYVDWAAQEAG